MRVYLVRRGESRPEEEDPQRRLTDEGVRNVQNVARFLRPLGLKLETIWHSGKHRAQQTAEILAGAVSATWVQHVTIGSGSEAPPQLGSCEIDATKETLMTDDRRTQTLDDESSSDLSRRDFVAMSLAAALPPAPGLRRPRSCRWSRRPVEVKTPDGICDAAFIHPTSGSHPGVLIGRTLSVCGPSMREMASASPPKAIRCWCRIRSIALPRRPFTDASTFNFANPDDMTKLGPLMGSVNAPGSGRRDAVAYVAFLDAQRQVNKTKKIGTQGYCMGGPLVVKTAATLPNRVGAGGSFHGGGLVTDKPDSPHLLASKIKARMYFGIASNDDMRQPDAKDKLKEAFAAAKVPAEIEVYSASLHGWCVPDMPLQNGSPIYNKPDAERAWAKLVALYKTALA